MVQVIPVRVTRNVYKFSSFEVQVPKNATVLPVSTKVFLFFHVPSASNRYLSL